MATNSISTTRTLRIRRSNSQRWGCPRKDRIPGALQVTRLNEEHISRQDIPLEHREIKCIFETKMKEQTRYKQVISKSFKPDQGSKGKFQSKSKPASKMQYCRVL